MAKVTFVGRLTANGIEKIDPVILPRLTNVFHIDGFNGDCYGAIIEEPNISGRQKCVSFSESNPRFFSITEYALPLSRKFGIGTYYLDDLSKADEEKVRRFIALAEESELREEEKKRIQAEKSRKECEELPAKFPFLRPLTAESRSHETKACIANVRLHLKHEFPNFKFSVRKEHYDCIYVSWEDGPTRSSVEEVISRYSDHHFDSTGDYMDYSPSNFNRVFGGVKHIFAQRDMSEQTRTSLKSWAESLNDQDDLYGCRDKSALTYSLFCSYDIYGEISVEKIEKISNGCRYEPASFWRIVSTKK
ncbi:MAG TPA: hypothetical protein PKW61_00105 [Tenuifilaceae bacterium]|nr:hypothetical protein [Tenuifilaceae bacterium]